MGMPITSFTGSGRQMFVRMCCQCFAIDLAGPVCLCACVRWLSKIYHWSIPHPLYVLDEEFLHHHLGVCVPKACWWDHETSPIKIQPFTSIYYSVLESQLPMQSPLMHRIPLCTGGTSKERKRLCVHFPFGMWPLVIGGSSADGTVPNLNSSTKMIW